MLCDRCEGVEFDYLTTTFKDKTRHVVRVCRKCGSTQFVDKVKHAHLVTGAYQTKRQRREQVENMLRQFD